MGRERGSEKEKKGGKIELSQFYWINFLKKFLTSFKTDTFFELEN